MESPSVKRIVAGLVCLLSLFVHAHVDITWGGDVALPSLDGKKANPGVARPFAGVDNGWVLLAGGANFPDVPLAKGGKKRFHVDVYGLDCAAREPSWKIVGQLPTPGGEGASTSTPKGIVCVGGATGAAGKDLTSKSFLMRWKNGKVDFSPLPDFPYPVRMPAMAADGLHVYVAGGEGSLGAKSDVWMLDLGAARPEWTALPPLPQPCGQPVAVIQNDAHKRRGLFVFGGMALPSDAKKRGQALEGGWSLTLEPTAATAWETLPAVAVKGNPEAARRTMIGASALASGDQHILIFGGSDRVLWNGCVLKADDFRFGRSVLAYHTVTRKWFELKETPFAGRCGAAVLRLPDGRILLASGEIAAGIRTNACALGTFTRARRFHPLNLAVIILFFVGMAAMGFYFMRRNKNSDDYFRGGGRLPWWAVSMSIFATMVSSITFISIPAMSYLADCRYFVITIGIIALAPIVAHFYLPLFRRMNLTSAYEYLERRFNLGCRLFASAAFTLFMVARTAVVTYLPAIAISAVIDLDVNVAIIVVTVITILYCTVGGIEAVIWSDFIQSVILIAGTLIMFAVMIWGTDGGFAGFVSLGEQADKFRILDFALDWTQPVFWVVLVGGLVANLASYTSDQCVVQRYMTTADEKGAAKSILTNGVLSFANSFVFFILGVALYTFYASNPGLLDVTMPKNDSVLPIFIANDLPPGISGLVLAALAAATMSTLSSNLNSAATAVTTDFYMRLFPHVTDKGKMRCGQIFTILTGLFGGVFALVLANQNIYSIYDQFQRFLGVLTGGLGCLFFMGVFMKRVNGKGAIAGLVANYAVCLALDQLSFAGKPHILLYGAIGMVACLIVATIVSFVWRESDDDKLQGLCWVYFTKSGCGRLGEPTLPGIDKGKMNQ